MTLKNDRQRAFDILRGIGILLMVMGHIGFGQGLDQYIHAFHMPIFFFVSGYFYKPEKYTDTGKFLLHSAKTLLIPYTVFVLLCQPLHYIYTGEWSFSYFILSFFTSNHNRIDVAGAYWFLLCMFTAKVIFHLTAKYCRGFFLPLVSAVLTIIGCFWAPRQLPLCLDSALSVQFLMVIGYYWRVKRDSRFVTMIQKLPWYGIVLGLVLNGVLIFLNQSVNVRTNYYGFVPLFWLNAVVSTAGWYLLSCRIAEAGWKVMKAAGSVLAYFGSNSLTFLVLNEIAIFAVKRIPVFSALIIGEGETITVPFLLSQLAVLCLTMAVLSLAAEVFNRTKLKVLLGKF